MEAVIRIARVLQCVAQTRGGRLLNATVALSHVAGVLMNVLGPAGALGGELVGAHLENARSRDVNLDRNRSIVGDVTVSRQQRLWLRLVSTKSYEIADGAIMTSLCHGSGGHLQKVGGLGF